MATFIDAQGVQSDLKVEPTLWVEAASKGLSLPQLINQKYPTSAEAHGSTFSQLCASSGLILSKDQEFGFRPPTIGAVLNGQAELSASSMNTVDANPTSRVLFPAVIMEMIESQLAVDRTTDPNAFDQMIGLETSVNSARIEQPVINLTPAEAGRSKAISQLSKPDQMMTITTADQTKRIPVYSLGLQVSDQALQATTLDFVSLAVRRQAEVQRNANVYADLLNILNGDLDEGTSALPHTHAVTYDAASADVGEITKLALVNWLINNYFTRRISHIVCNADNAISLSNLMSTTNTGIQVPGLNPSFRFMNRDLSNIDIFVCEASAGWTANTLMGLDKRYAIHRIRNTMASYSAIEQFVLRRATELRFDFSSIVVRLFDNAFDVLSLTAP